MTNKENKTDKRAFYDKFIAACSNGDSKTVQELKQQISLARLFYIGKQTIYPSIEERCHITVYAIPFFAALRGWKKHPNQASADTVKALLPQQMHANLPVIKVVFKSEYRPYRGTFSQKNYESYTFTLSDFIHNNKKHLNKQKCPAVLQPFYTSANVLEQISAHIIKEEPRKIKTDDNKQPFFPARKSRKYRYRGQ